MLQQLFAAVEALRSAFALVALRNALQTIIPLFFACSKVAEAPVVAILAA